MTSNLNDIMTERSTESQKRINEIAENLLLEVKLQAIREELESTQSQLNT
ncbi:MAG: hypothetical protein ACI8WB_003231 [Phenylobacterium sp.]|jgi:hypothetical protein